MNVQIYYIYAHKYTYMHLFHRNLQIVNFRVKICVIQMQYGEEKTKAFR